ncbi:MAG: Ig-like domain-containing protein, partial [Verrucomicrobiota bacterium]
MTINPDGSYTFVPVPVFRGGVGFPYTVCDDGSPTACATATLYFIVTSFNTDPDINATFVNVPVPGDVHTNDDVVVNTTYGTPILIAEPAGGTYSITMNTDGTYVFTGDKPGIYNFNVPVCAPASVTPPCVNELLTISVIDQHTNINPPIANTDIAFSLGQPVTLKTLANDAAGNPGGSLVPSSVSIVPFTIPNPITEGTVSVTLSTGDITFTPVPTYAGVLTYNYTVCDNSVPPLCTTALQHVTVLLSGTTEAADDYNFTPTGVTLTVPASSGVLYNDTDPELDLQTVTTTSPMTVAGKGTVTIAADGSYVFVPYPGYSGPVSFVYTIVDNGTPVSYANATLYILVTPLTDLSVIKTVDKPTPYVGSNVTFTITATNNGPSTGTGVFVWDELPSGYSVVTVTPSVGTWTSPNWTIGTLASGASATLSFLATVNATGTYTNTAMITGREEDPDMDNNISSRSVAPVNVLLANIDYGTPVNGYVGGTSVNNVLVNDLLNGAALNPAAVTTTFVGSSDPKISLSGTSVLVAAGTPAGTYTLTYQICEIINPANCDTALVRVPVSAAAIVANDDDASGTPVNGYSGGTAVANVLTNDLLNGAAVIPAKVVITALSDPADGVTLNTTTGAVTVSPGVAAGTYTITYQICEILNPTNCDDALITVAVSAPPIIANDDAGSTVNGYTGGTSFTNVLVNDLLNGVSVIPAKVTLTFISSSYAGVSLSGSNVVVAALTPEGTYTLTYQICEVLNPTNCDQAVVTVPVMHYKPAAVNDANTTNENTLVSGAAQTNDTPSVDGGNVWGLTGTNGGAAHGTATMDALGNYTYLPVPGYLGTDAFTYHLCDADLDCSTATVTITVLPNVLCHGDFTSCYYALPFHLVDLGGFTPSGGTFSGAGITGDVFNPAAAGAGTHTITYSYTINTYSNTCTTTITVDEANAITLAGQVKYRNSAETYMQTPFQTDISGTQPPDYFYVALYDSATVINMANPLFNAIEWRKVDIATAEIFNNGTGLWEVDTNMMSFFRFNTPLNPQQKYYITVWDGSNVYQEYLNKGTSTGNVYNPELGSAYTWNNWGGVSALDALAMQYMINGYTQINAAPYNWNWVGDKHYTGDLNYGFYSNAIANVNSVNNITALDALTTQYRIAGLQPTFPNMTPNFRVAGRFVETLPKVTWHSPFDSLNFPADVNFVKSGANYTYFTKAISNYYRSSIITGKPFSLVKQEALHSPVGTCPDYGYINIYYTATGDVNASYIPPSPEFKGGVPSVSLEYENELTAQKGDIVTIPIRIDRNANLGAITLGMKYRNDLVKVVEVPGYEVVNINPEEGFVRLAWADLAGRMVSAGEVIVNIKVMVLSNMDPGTRLFELENMTELGTVEAERMEDVTLKTVTLTSRQAGGADMFIANYPNPLDTKTTFTYNLPEQGKVELVVYDKLGKRISTLIDKDQDAGLHSLEINTFDLAPGVYSYRLVLQGTEHLYSVTKSMMV